MVNVRVQTFISVSTFLPISCFMIYVCHSFEFPQIQKFVINELHLKDKQPASYCLGKFLSLLSHLTHLEIHSCRLHDDFYNQIADRASSTQVKKIKQKLVKVEEKQKMHNTFLCLFGEVYKVPLSYRLNFFLLSFIHISVCMTYLHTPYFIVFPQIHTSKVKHLK